MGSACKNVSSPCRFMIIIWWILIDLTWFCEPSLHCQDRTPRKSWRRVPVWQVTATLCKCEHLSTSDTNRRKPRHFSLKNDVFSPQKLPKGIPTTWVGICKARFSFSERVMFHWCSRIFSFPFHTVASYHDFTGAPSAITSSSRKAKSFSSWLVVFFNLIHGSTLQWLSGVDQVNLLSFHSNCGIRTCRPRSFERWQPSQYQGLSLQPAAASLSISNARHLIVSYCMIHTIILYPAICTHQWLTLKNLLLDLQYQIRESDLTAMMAIFESAHCLGDIGLLIAGCNSFWGLLCSYSDLRWQRGIYKKNPCPPEKIAKVQGMIRWNGKFLTYT